MSCHVAFRNNKLSLLHYPYVRPSTFNLEDAPFQPKINERAQGHSGCLGGKYADATWGEGDSHVSRALETFRNPGHMDHLGSFANADVAG